MQVQTYNRREAAICLDKWPIDGAYYVYRVHVGTSRSQGIPQGIQRYSTPQAALLAFTKRVNRIRAKITPQDLSQ
jgi:hypothetical protein